MFKLEASENHLVQETSTFCSLPYTKLILNSWGEVSMCCHQLTQLGKLDATTDILDLWNSDLAKEIRAETSAGNLHPVCASWNSCPYIVKEREFGPVETYKRIAYPLHLEIALPDTHCNVGGENPSEDNPACIMCRRNFQVTHTPDLTDFLCEKAKPIMPYLKSLCVLGIAEPFWKDKVFQIFDTLEFCRYRDKILFTTNTNGTCLTERVSRRFFEEVMWSSISWSIDGASRDTHLKIRRLDTFGLVIDNIARWLRLREEYGGRDRHQVSIYNNINLLNVHEMSAMVEMANGLGVDKLIMLPTYDQAGVVQLGELILGPKNVKVFKDAALRAKEMAANLGVNLEYPKPFDVVPPPVA